MLNLHAYRPTHMKFGSQNTPASAAADREKAEQLARHMADLSARRGGDTVLSYSPYLALMMDPNGWGYATRPNASGVVSVMTLIKTPTKEYVVFLKTERPPLKGVKTAEPVAGLQGDTDTEESSREAAIRELDEELGIEEETGRPLDNQAIELGNGIAYASPGMTDEGSRYFLVEHFLTDEEVEKVKKHKPEGDGKVIQGQIWIPLNTFVKDPSGTLTDIAQQHGLPTKSTLTGLMLLIAHLQKTKRLRMELIG